MSLLLRSDGTAERYDFKMETPVEIFSATDPPHVVNQQVWYWLEFAGTMSARLTSWAPVNELANVICAAAGTCIIDRSDKDSGLLRSFLT